MNAQRDTILIIDDDAAARTLLREQVFSSEQYRVVEAQGMDDGLVALRTQTPDLILVDLQLPNLTGHDVMVAFKAQGYHGPLIAMGERGSPRAATEALRLGATDYVTKPLREAEVLAAVERGLEDVRLRRHHDQMRQQLTEANTRLDARVKELHTLYEIGQAVTALRDLASIFEQVMEGAITLTQADQAFLLLRDDKSGHLVLRAGRNLSLSMLDRMGEAVTDQLAELVMSSRKDMLVEGEGLRRFKVSRELHATAYVPLVVQNKAIGVLAVGNIEKKRAFHPHHARLLRSLADYAAIAIVSVRLSHLLAQRAQAIITVQQQSRLRDAQRSRQVKDLLTRLHQALIMVESELLRLSKTEKMPQEAQQRIRGLSQQVRQLITHIMAFSRQQ